MDLDRRSVLRSLGTAAALGVAGPRVTGLLRRAELGAGAGQRLGGFRAQGSGDGGWRLSEPRAAGRTFTMVGLTVPPGARVEVRASADGERFGPWLAAPALEVEGEGPDEGREASAAGNGWKRSSTPVWTRPATHLQLRVAGGRPDAVEAVLLDTRAAESHGALAPASTAPAAQPALWRGSLEEPDTILRASSGLRIVRRHEWGADESLRGDPAYADRVVHGVVHHTAGSNDYSPSEAPGIVNGIYRYHVQSNGWKDIGYNLLVDRYGVVYEGRYGGLDRAVIGAHARGANTGSFGVGVLGDFRSQQLPWEAMQALFEVLVWKFQLHAIVPGPDAWVQTVSGQWVQTLAGHRDVGSTTCPGGHLYDLLPTWREGLADRVEHDGFTDISRHPHEQAIRDLRAAGVTNGYSDGTYRPDENVTRAQMATFITRAAPLEPGDGVDFHDVTSSHPHFDGIAAVAAAGISEGRADGSFRPANDVTRGQMASFLARALDLEPLDNETFSDVTSDHPHYGTIEALAGEEIALGRGDGTYHPDQPVTRGQMASFLVRAFEIPSEDEGLEEPEEHDEHDEDEEAVEDDGDGESTDDGETTDDGDSTDDGDTTDDGDSTDDGDVQQAGARSTPTVTRV